MYDPAAAWFAINPSTGTLTELFTGNDQFMGASSGVTVAALINDAHAVLINGVTYSESKSTIVGANISPDGAHVAVSRISDYEGCAGYTPKNTVEMVTVANQSHVDLQNLTAEGWWDADQFIANNLSGSTWIYSLEGKAVSEISSATSSLELGAFRVSWPGSNRISGGLSLQPPQMPPALKKQHDRLSQQLI